MATKVSAKTAVLAVGAADTVYVIQGGLSMKATLTVPWTFGGDVNVTGNVTPAKVVAGSGSAAAPSYTFGATPTSGLYLNAAGIVSIAHAGAESIEFYSTGVFLPAGHTLGWLSSGLGSATDLYMERDAANTLALRNGTNAQAFRVYNTFTDAANYERGFARWTSNVFKVGNEAAGTGTSRDFTVDSARDLNFALLGVNYWRITSGGAHLLAATDNLVDLGASGANRPRSLYWGTQALAPDGSVGTPSIAFASETNTGFYKITASAMGTVLAGVLFQYFDGSGPSINASGSASGYRLGATAAAPDVVLGRDASDVFAQRRGTAAQVFRIYNTFTDAVNYERMALGWTANEFFLQTQQAGTGTSRSLRLSTQGTAPILFSTNGTSDQFRVAHTASAVNFGQVSGGATGNPVVFSAVGGDATVNFVHRGTGATAQHIFDSGGVTHFTSVGVAGGNRNITITASNGGNPTIGTTAGLLAIQAGVTCGSSIRAADATAIPAGGTAGVGLTFSSTANYGTFFGSGAPTLSAAKGSLYLRSDGTTTNNRAYINTDGGTTWTAITTVA